ncbi:hypothetical protein PMI01_04587 [Caulobacter sp. AP07]|uniref:hypothetical protein n=1 Tax=Caulobacter sp. AP07 TaxID=1144304 RepID=UPI0002721BB3|nr:hypothetical protein [Caulobacter sp. AP07]EJL24709.1 hypothetical protein PMI01_04587 [Caulobacter sp. AP07]
MTRRLAATGLLALGVLAGCAPFRAPDATPEHVETRPEPKTFEELTSLQDAMLAMWKLPKAEREAILPTFRGYQTIAPGSAPSWLPMARRVEIRNPTDQPLTLSLYYATPDCSAKTLVVPARGKVSTPLCLKIARVRIVDNDPTIAAGWLQAKNCYALGRWDGPPRWALDACSS